MVRKGLNKKRTRFVTGVVAFIYWAVPVIQFASYDSFTDKVNDHYIFFISAFVYQFFEMFEKAPTPILIQLVFFLLTWWGSYKLVVLYKNRKKKTD